MGNVNRKKLILVSAFSAFLFAAGLFLAYWLQTPYNWVIKIIGVFVLGSVIELITQKILKSRAMLLALGCVAIWGICIFVLIPLINMVLSPFVGNFEGINLLPEHITTVLLFLLLVPITLNQNRICKKRREAAAPPRKRLVVSYIAGLCAALLTADYFHIQNLLLLSELGTVLLMILLISACLALLSIDFQQRLRDEAIEKYKSIAVVKEILETYDDAHQIAIPTPYIEKVDELIRYGIFKKLGNGLVTK